MTSPALTEGVHTLDITATDVAGNTSPSNSVSITILDITAPLAPTVTAVDADTTAPFSTTDSTPTITGTGEVGSTITLKNASGTVLGTGTVDASGNWSITPSTPLPE